MRVSLPEFDAAAYLKEAMALDNGLETGAAVGHAVAPKEPVEGIPQDVPEEGPAEVPEPSSQPDLQPPAVAEPADAQKETDTDYAAVAQRADSELPESLPEAAGSVGVPETPSDQGGADPAVVEPPAASGGGEKVDDVIDLGETVENPPPQVPPPTKQLTTDSDVPEPLAQAAQRDLEYFNPQPENSEKITEVDKPQPQQLQEFSANADAPANWRGEDWALPEIERPAAHSTEDLDDFQFQSRMLEPEVYRVEDTDWSPVNPYSDELRMDLDDPMGPSVPRKGGY